MRGVPIDIPSPDGRVVSLDPIPGRPIVIVGPNGSGKSALSVYLQTRLGESVNRIFAHRRLWLDSAAPELTSRDRSQWADNFFHWDRNPESRWRDQNDKVRVSAIVLDLLNRQNYVDSLIAESFRKGQDLTSIATQGPLQVLNSILESSALPISVAVAAHGDLECINTNGARYSVAEMSDGEKAALLLAGDVLVAPEGATHLIDEPERHLHRAISASLITSLIEVRASDRFIVFTHDLDLAQYLGRVGSTFVVTRCDWEGKQPRSWEIVEVPSGMQVPDSVRRAILGGRSQIAFHEGSVGGLDQELYEALLRGWSVLPVGNCATVLRSVKGLQEVDDLHWIKARGVVDRDFRRAWEPSSIKQLALHEVENVFYSSTVISWMAKMQAQIFGRDAEQIANDAFAAMRSALSDSGVRAHIITQRALQWIRDELADGAAEVTKFPDSGTVSLSSTADTGAMASEYDELLGDSGPIDDFLALFPIRESGVRRGAASSLLFSTAGLYEAAVIQQVRNSEEFRETMLRTTGLADLQDS